MGGIWRTVRDMMTTFRGLSGRARLQYAWDYFRYPLLVAVCVIWLLGALIAQYVTRRDPLLEVIMVNPSTPFAMDAGDFDAFLEEYGYERFEGSVSIASFLLNREGGPRYQEDYMTLLVLLTGQPDLFFGTGPEYLEIADQGRLADLSQLLPEEVLKKHKSALLFSDSAGEREPYPCAVLLPQGHWMTGQYYEGECWFGVLERAGHWDTAREFAEYLLGER